MVFHIYYICIESWKNISLSLSIYHRNEFLKIENRIFLVHYIYIYISTLSSDWSTLQQINQEFERERTRQQLILPALFSWVTSNNLERELPNRQKGVCSTKTFPTLSDDKLRGSQNKWFSFILEKKKI